MRAALLGASLCAGVASAALGQQAFLLIPDWRNDRICALSPVDGSVINANFIPTNPQLFDSPKHALPTPLGTILVSDQVKDAIYEFDGFGNYLRTIVNLQNNGVDNIRGIAIRAGKLYVTVGSGVHANTIQRFNLDGTGQETFIGTGRLNSPFGIFFRESDLLVTNSGSHLIQRFDSNGVFLNTWVGTTIRFPQQITRRRSNGNLLVAGFSSPAGVYEYTEAGVLVRYYPVGAPRGAYELENGLILFTDGTGVKVFDPNAPDPAATIQTLLGDGNYQYIELYEVLAGDVNRDRCVNNADLLEVLFAFGQSGGRADVNSDGTVNNADLLLVLFNFGNGCE
ncbi:MAG: dockerin type I domain-containing protein [Armatimonadota bacterium]|nr:dockerin type I domain-containing protein [Armatimonadota bacterium]